MFRVVTAVISSPLQPLPSQSTKRNIRKWPKSPHATAVRENLVCLFVCFCPGALPVWNRWFSPLMLHANESRPRHQRPASRNVAARRFRKNHDARTNSPFYSFIVFSPVFLFFFNVISPRATSHSYHEGNGNCRYGFAFRQDRSPAACGTHSRSCSSVGPLCKFVDASRRPRLLAELVSIGSRFLQISYSV